MNIRGNELLVALHLLYLENLGVGTLDDLTEAKIRFFWRVFSTGNSFGASRSTYNEAMDFIDTVGPDVGYLEFRQLAKLHLAGEQK